MTIVALVEGKNEHRRLIEEEQRQGARLQQATRNRQVTKVTKALAEGKNPQAVANTST